MPGSARVSSLSQRLLSLALALGLFMSSTASAAITAGGLAVIGFSDNNLGPNSDDDFVLVATEFIAAGEVIYLTNTGWSSSGGSSGFYAVSPGTESGSQQLVRLTVNTGINPGTLISSADITNTAFTWKTSGSITGLFGSAEYSKLDLVDIDENFFPAGDQIYVFQSTDPDNPMDVPPDQLSFIYLMDNSEPFSPGFENPSSDFLGANYPLSADVAQGLSPFDHTAVELLSDTYPTGLHTDIFGLDLSAAEIQDLQTNGGTKAQWLEAIANADNWIGGIMPSTPLNILGVPEPSRVVLLMSAFGVVILRRRRPR
jgi:hypothetical protein